MKSKGASTNLLSDETIAEYLTAELSSLTERALQYESIVSSKINYYLAIVTAVIGGGILSAEIEAIREVYFPVVTLASFFLFLVGWLTLKQGVDQSTHTILMFRRMARLRQWFLDNRPDLYPYLPFTPGDNRPRIYLGEDKLLSSNNNDETKLAFGVGAPSRNAEMMVVAINASIIGLWFAMLWLYLSLNIYNLNFSHEEFPYFISIILGAIAFLITWNREVKYVEKVLSAIAKQEHEKGNIHFPHHIIAKKYSKFNTQEIE